MSLGETALIPSHQLFSSPSKLDNILNDRVLSLEDNIFVENVIADIHHFLRQGEENRKSVLIFPPVNNYRRFLIHKVCEDNVRQELSTFSVGQGFNRRTVVCFRDLVRKPGLINKSHVQPSQHLRDQTLPTMVVERPTCPESSSPEHQCQNGIIKRGRAIPAIYRPPAARKLEALHSQVKQNRSVKSSSANIPVTNIVSKAERTRSGTRQRRPDLQVYVPRAKRASMTDQSSAELNIRLPEILSADQQLFGLKKKGSKLTSEFQNISVNSNFDKSSLISTPLIESDDDGIQSLKKNNNNDVVRESSGAVMVENTVNETSLQSNTENSALCKNNNCDNPALVAFKENFIHEVLHDSAIKCEIISESEDSVSLPSNNGNDCYYVCKDSNNTYENFSDSENERRVLCVNDIKECDDNVETRSERQCRVLGKEFCDEKDVKDPLQCVSNQEKTLLQEKSSEENVVKVKRIFESKEKEDELHKRSVNACFISDVLMISEPEPSVIPHDSLLKDNQNVVKENIISKQAKVKPKKLDESRETGKMENLGSNTTTNSVSVTSTITLNPEECTWDMLFDDNGDCLDPKILEELTNAVGSVTIEKPQSDYNRFVSKPEINLPGGDSEFAHVVEIYNFPPEFKTQDLLTIFAPYKNGGFEIKWVDDTHALGVFSSSRVAADVLAYEHPFVKTRSLSEATPESRIKARRSAEFLQPYRARPETCVAMARRLVTGALGMRIATSREEREAERRLLKEAREKKKLAAQQQLDAWEGTIR